MTDPSPAELTVVRIKLGNDRPAPQPDPLGRARIGFAPGLTTSELWERGRGLWKAKLPNVAASDLVLLVADDVVVLAGTVGGVAFAGDRIVITGSPDAHHPLIGSPDPLANASRNPIAYGTVRTVPASPQEPAQRAFDEVLSDAIAVLTEAGRLRRPRLRQSAAGKWEPHPTETDPADWAEFVTLALAGAAANLGGIEEALSGRPGSWEASKVGDVLLSTLGEDDAELWRHRTEPFRATLNVDDILADYSEAWAQYDEAERALDTRRTEAEEADPAPAVDEYFWSYEITGPGELRPESADAPPWSWGAWREHIGNREYAERIEQGVRAGKDLLLYESLRIPRSPEAGAAYERLLAEREARLERFDDQLESLEIQKVDEWNDYGNRLRDRLAQVILAATGGSVPVLITVDPTDTPIPLPSPPGYIQNWISRAVADTPSPADLPGTPLGRLGI